MPGNELGDKVHNFFAQNNLLQEQHRLQDVEENWPAVNNYWEGRRRQSDVVESNTETYNLHNSSICNWLLEIKSSILMFNILSLLKVSM